MLRRLVPTIAFGWLPACALVADLGADYGAPTVPAGDDASAATETTTDGEDRVRADVAPPPDAPIGDAAPPPDAGDADADADAGAKPDTGGDPGCGALGQHDFCDAFDTGTFGKKWDSMVGQVGAATTPTPVSLLYCAAFSVGGATTDSHLLIGHDLPPMRRAVLNAQLQSDIHSMTSGTTLELARILAVDDSANELGGAYFRATSSGIRIEVCDKNGTCNFMNNVSVGSSTGWHAFRFDVTLGQSGAVTISWMAYGTQAQEGPQTISYGATVARIRTVIGAKAPTGAAFAYWDNVTIDWY